MCNQDNYRSSYHDKGMVVELGVEKKEETKVIANYRLQDLKKKKTWIYYLF